MSAQPALDGRQPLETQWKQVQYGFSFLHHCLIFPNVLIQSWHIFCLLSFEAWNKKKQFSIERFPIHVVPNGFRFTLCVYLGFCFVSFFFQLWASAWQSLSCLNELLVTNGIGFASSTTLQNFFSSALMGQVLFQFPACPCFYFNKKMYELWKKG